MSCFARIFSYVANWILVWSEWIAIVLTAGGHQSVGWGRVNLDAAATGRAIRTLDVVTETTAVKVTLETSDIEHQIARLDTLLHIRQGRASNINSTKRRVGLIQGALSHRARIEAHTRRFDELEREALQTEPDRTGVDEHDRVLGGLVQTRDFGNDEGRHVLARHGVGGGKGDTVWSGWLDGSRKRRGGDLGVYEIRWPRKGDVFR